ncbi:MAG: hypothetical protein PWR27_1255 [Petroclostridium sp.]|jgi:membrane-bound metal-dependent hydrolase YbcI (DUF457 family)|uniref:hypothetical protein n=1 Tax=Petroclostridium xylanilyticum TaxID=1792311 RepID=UPI0012FF7128|nr:hypothetical protein [Petroclostridium xylanilyticum]MBZ4644681.1 hypothetical protein [Clostridia bacterium]MDK2810546.1 hypothetical protein [Petroclostridium sp.]
MYRVTLKKAVYPIIILTILIGVAFWVLSVKKMNDKIPSRGVFVYSKEFYTA